MSNLFSFFIDSMTDTLEVLYEEIKVLFIKRESITLEELQDIINVMRKYNWDKKPKEQKNKLNPKIVNLIEKGYIRKLNTSRYLYKPFFKDFKTNILIIRKLIVEISKDKPLHISSSNKERYPYDVVFESTHFEVKKEFLSGGLGLDIRIQSAVKIALSRNKFKNLYLAVNIGHKEFVSTVSIYNSKFSSPVFFHLSCESAGALSSSVITLNENIFNDDLIIWDDLADWEVPVERKQSYSLKLISNQIKCLEISEINESDCFLTCVSGNHIDEFRISEKYPEIRSWGLKEKIRYPKNENLIATKSKINRSKDMFIAFKQQASSKKHKLHEIIFQEHINRCDIALINLEPISSSWQEQIIMFMARISSNHGTSWALPIFHIAWINLIIAILAIVPILPQPIGKNSLDFIVEHLSSFARLYFELFNPLVTLNNIADKIHFIEPSWWLSLLTIFNKFFYAICGYEFLRAARRFTPR